ncbi:MAG TPA: sigma-70 family RNA polymerase sigma factor [Gaiellales bacterium]|jgi:RNA polymerase sigma-70 factor (ECF subfamily)
MALNSDDRDSAGAFTCLYDAEAAGLLAFFARRTFDANVAAELTAETWAAAYAAWARFRERGAGPAPWLYAIARRKLARYYRTGRVDAKARRRLGLPDVALSGRDLERVEELIDFERLGRAVARGLAGLSVRERDAVTLRVVEEREYADVAALLRCSEEAARARVSRALRHLALALERDGALG